MSSDRLIHPSRPLRRAKLENVALVPGNLLPFKDQWQAIANRLPRGDVLIVLPSTDSRQRTTFERVAALIRAKGHHVTTLSAGELRARLDRAGH